MNKFHKRNSKHQIIKIYNLYKVVEWHQQLRIVKSKCLKQIRLLRITLKMK
jgi:hypothetical protein